MLSHLSRTANMSLLSTAVEATLSPSFWTVGIYISCRLFWFFKFGYFLFVLFFLKSEKDVSTSGFNNFQGGMCKGKFESSICFWTLNIFVIFAVWMLIYLRWKTQSNAWLSMFAFSLTMYCRVSLSRRNTRGGSFAAI